MQSFASILSLDYELKELKRAKNRKFHCSGTAILVKFITCRCHGNQLHFRRNVFGFAVRGQKWEVWLNSETIMCHPLSTIVWILGGILLNIDDRTPFLYFFKTFIFSELAISDYIQQNPLWNCHRDDVFDGITNICSNSCHFTFRFFLLVHNTIGQGNVLVSYVLEIKKFEIQGLKFEIQRLELIFLIAKIKVWILKIKVGRC